MTTISSTLPAAPRPASLAGVKSATLFGGALGAIAVGAAVSALVQSNTVMSLLTQAVIYAIFALGPGFLLKQNGMISFGHALFFALPGYLIGLAFREAALAAELALPLVLLAVGGGAFLLGLVIVRVPGIAFGMLTLAIGQGFYVAASKARGVTGGADGMNIDLPPQLFGIAGAAFQDPARMFMLCWSTLVLLILALALLLRSRFGPLTEAIRENEERVRFIGFATLLPRAAIFAISAMLSAAGGILSCLYTGFISPESLHWSVSGAVLIMVILGGGRSLWGPAVGAVVYYLARDYLGGETTHWMSIFGVSLIAVTVLWPSGIAGALERAAQGLRGNKETP